MGLDGTIEQVDINRVIDNFSFDNKPSNSESDKGVKETFYWRKNYNLQDFMTNLYFNKGGKSSFNNAYVRIEEEDLDNLDYEAMFGHVNLDEGRMNEFRDFITNGKIALQNGYALYYYCSF